MRATVVRPHELGPPELARWEALRAQDPALGNPFLSAAFAQAVGRVTERARVAVLEDAGEVVGFFAFERRLGGVGQAIGAGVSDAQAVICPPELVWRPRDLLAAAGLSVWEFSHLIGAQAPPQGAAVTYAPSPVVDLDGGFAHYLGRHAKGSRVKRTLRYARKLEREHGELRFAFDCRDPGVLDQLMRWKSAQYRRTGRRDRFAQPWIRALVEDLVDARPAGCEGTLSALWSGDRLLAAYLSLRSGPVLAGWFPAYDVDVRGYSPGLVLQLRLIEAAAGAGIRLFDLGKGESDYKESLKTGDLTVAEGWLQRPSAGAVLRAAQREPRRRALAFVLARPALRLAARRALVEVGRAREAPRRAAERVRLSGS
jgi:CelD/BcsL family acetyltransferase involved in cellulose biosynthesis